MSQTNSAGPYLDDSVNQHFMSMLENILIRNLITIIENNLKLSLDSVQISQQTTTKFDLEFISELFCIYYQQLFVIFVSNTI